jgi:ATP-binding cassette subfamily C protein
MVGILVLLVAIIFLKAAILYLATALIARASASITTNMRRQLLRATMSANWKHLTHRRTGELSSAIGSEPSRVSFIYVQGCLWVALVLKTLSYVVLAFFLSWQVTIAAVIGGIVSFFALHRFVRTSRDAGRNMTKLQSRFLSRLLSALTGIKAVRAMGAEDKFLPFMESDLDSWEIVQAQQILSVRSLQIAQEPLRVIALSLLLPFMVGYWTQNPEDLLVLALLFARINSEMGTLQGIYQQIASHSSAFFFIHEQISAAESSRERTGGIPPPMFKKSIVLDDVSFEYDKVPILTGANLELPAGSFTVILGPSGAGKTTIADLILGLLEPTQGQVQIDGTPLRSIHLTQWRKLIGYVPQEPVLLHDSVRSNIVLGDKEISDDAIDEALHIACSKDFLESLEEGLDTSVGEQGGRFSGGQRQRIAIARALCRRPRLLILDEATSALDPAVELRVCETLRELAGDMTVLAISHQETITRMADKVYRLSDGKLEPVASSRA